ncbi:hypothetical protein H9Q74_011106 [Fusarium xylarioides]|nr:hypothetical protein H9Q71_011250 [Fusarium xylarioides]KAG5816444.1 hypothetical protein H9Q74_011106 [Fusarium xylarioides]
MTQDKKTVVVIGATGLQGGSVVRTLAKSQDRYNIRGLTRNISSPKAEALKELGIEMHQADVDDPESLQRAFEGANAIFAMTDFWQHMSAAKEEEQGRRIMDIAADLPNLEQIIWPSLPDAKTISNGKRRFPKWNLHIPLILGSHIRSLVALFSAGKGLLVRKARLIYG